MSWQLVDLEYSTDTVGVRMYVKFEKKNFELKEKECSGRYQNLKNWWIGRGTFEGRYSISGRKIRSNYVNSHMLFIRKEIVSWVWH